MSAFTNLAPEDQQRLEVAAAWWSRLQKDPAAELSGEFLDWVADPGNEHAFKAVESTMTALDDLGVTANILDLRRSALKQLRNADAQRWSPKTLLYAVAAAAVLVMLGGGLLFYIHSERTLSYQTDVGERRVITLADGSRVSLDSNSEVDVGYSKNTRSITLARGRARFDVVHDVARPFTVTAGAETVVAVGTSFDVERRGQKVLVTLIQGRVLVKRSEDTMKANLAAASRTPVPLVAGQQMSAVGDQAPTVASADLSITQAWEMGHLVFRGEPLGEAVEQVNRYTDHPIVVDPSAAAIQISGVFNTGDIGSFVSAMTSYFPVDATTDAASTITLQKRS